MFFYASVTLMLGRPAPLEVDILLQLYRPGQPGLGWRVIRPDIGPPGPITLFKTQALDRAVTGIAQPARGPRRRHSVINRRGIFDRQVQLPAQFADICDAQRPHRATGDADDLRCAEFEPVVRNVAAGHLFQNVARARPHQRQDRIGRGHIDQLCIHVPRNVA